MKNNDFPLIDQPIVYHVGFLDSNFKGTTHNRLSLEGNGLSVSLHPDGWREIARLGEAPLWQLELSGATFVDAHSLETSDWKKVLKWANKEGLVRETKVARVSWYDEEAEERRYFEFDLSNPDSKKNAQGEMEEYEENDPKMEFHKAWSATAELERRIGFKVETSLVNDMALTLYVQDVLYPEKNVQGVWWNDRHDIDSLSAPRGVIHTQALPTWKRTPCEMSDLEIEERLEKAQEALEFLASLPTPKIRDNKSLKKST